MWESSVQLDWIPTSGRSPAGPQSNQNVWVLPAISRDGSKKLSIHSAEWQKVALKSCLGPDCSLPSTPKNHTRQPRLTILSSKIAIEAVCVDFLDGGAISAVPEKLLIRPVPAPRIVVQAALEHQVHPVQPGVLDALDARHRPRTGRRELLIDVAVFLGAGWERNKTQRLRRAHAIPCIRQRQITWEENKIDIAVMNKDAETPSGPCDPMYQAEANHLRRKQNRYSSYE